MVPFKRFIIAHLFRGDSAQQVVVRLNTLGYRVVESEVISIFRDVKELLPESIMDYVKLDKPVPCEAGSAWFKHYDILDYMEFLELGSHADRFNSILWPHTYSEVAVIINTLLYNNEDHKVISSVLDYKYHHNMSQIAIEWYKKIFWETYGIQAQEILKRFKPFENNTLVLSEEGQEESDDRSSMAIIFRDNEYIKWKVGYNVKPPKARDFMDKVKADASFMYEEAKTIVQSVSRSISRGTVINPETGEPMETEGFSKSFKNLRSAQMSNMKAAVDLYIKADRAIPEESDSSEVDRFFERIEQMNLTYDVNERDKVVSGEDAKNILSELVR